VGASEEAAVMTIAEKDDMKYLPAASLAFLGLPQDPGVLDP
jgi:hypothetical protein